MASPAVAAKPKTLTPKAIIHQKFGDKASYEIEEVEDSIQNGCPGLAIPQKAPKLYRCRLQLPEISVVSEIFKRKKEAEQSAAEKAIEKLGLKLRETDPTPEEAWDDLVSRLSYLFSSEFLSTLQPLSGHFRAALQRAGRLNGFVPVSVIRLYDSKICNLCKYINPDVEFDPGLAISLIVSAVSKSNCSVLSSEELQSLRRSTPHPSDIMRSLGIAESSLPENVQVKAVRIPSCVGKAVESVTLNICLNGYYLDAIAKELGAYEASEVLISRSLGKSSSETRLFYSAATSLNEERSFLDCEDQATQFEQLFNVRASYLTGEEVHGNAILASIGYTWKSTDLYYEDMCLQAYHRMLANKTPTGIYKLSRDALLVAELPLAFTTKSNWRGSFPRDILCTFCRQHRLGEPVFSFIDSSVDSSPDVSGSRKKLKVSGSGQDKSGSNIASSSPVMCELKVVTKSQDLLLICRPNESYKKQMDAVQSTSLKVLLWFNLFLGNKELVKLTELAQELEIQFYYEQLLKSFTFCPSVHMSWHQAINSCDRSQSCTNSQPRDSTEDEHFPRNLGVENLGVFSSSGSLACICYTLTLVERSGTRKEILECSEEFEFEIGTGAVISTLEAAVTQISVGQTACVNLDLPSREFLVASAGESSSTFSLLSSSSCGLECTLTLLRVTAPSEERMEQALFNPPLSKQRVEYAVQHIKESSAISLVDFGCGSGSLLDSLLDYPTSLEKIVGVDISLKSLTRAAKMLHSKLNDNAAADPSSNTKYAVLYDGSITSFDSRLYGFDIGTCLEVIEHMEEDEASLFGNTVLSTFCPRVLIVSTPNYEYNIILQQSTPQCQEDFPDEKSQAQPCKFRNHDHKFEWTREQFCHWATDLATSHNYSVEFSGVGGTAGVEPGFASQIAVFRRKDDFHRDIDVAKPYKVVWEWSGVGVDIF